MNKKEGVLLSGGGRDREQAELSTNEKIFDQIVDFIFDGLKKIIRPDKEFEFRNALKGSIVATVRGYKKAFSNITVYDTLMKILEDRKIILSMHKFIIPVVAIEQNISEEINKTKRQVEKNKETLEVLDVQNVLKNLGKFKNITDTVVGELEPSDEEEVQ